MSNPLLSPDRFGSAAAPPAAWPDGSAGPQPGYGAPRAPQGPAGYSGPVPGGSYGRPGTLGGPTTGHGAGYGGAVPPAYDNVPGSAWPPAPPSAPETLRRGGVASATAVLLGIVAVTAVLGWQAVTLTTETAIEVIDGIPSTVETTSVSSVQPWVFAGVFVGLIIVIACVFRPLWARFLAPIYAAAEGVFIGAVSHVFEASFPGIVVQAVLLTFGVFLGMLVLYATGRIRVTPRFQLMVIAATFAVAGVYLVSLLLSLFDVTVPFIHDGGPIGIAFSVVVVAIAALNLALDFDFVDKAQQAGAPKQMEWFAALGLVVTLVWLYLEILRLLAKLRNN